MKDEVNSKFCKTRTFLAIDPLFTTFLTVLIVQLIFFCIYTELHFTDVSSSTVFVFDTVERHLKQIQRGEETITIEYSQRRPTAFKHSSGDKSQ